MKSIRFKSLTIIPGNLWPTVIIAILIVLLESFFLINLTRVSDIEPISYRFKDWQVIGNFIPVSKPGNFHDEIPISLIEKREFTLWISPPEYELTKGKLVSPVFDTGLNIGFYSFGNAGRPGNSIYLQNQVTGERIAIKTSSFNPNWTFNFVKVPKHWRGESLNFIAIKSSKGPNSWFAVSAPVSISFIAGLQYQIFLYLTEIAILVVFIMVSLLGFGLSITLKDRFRSWLPVPNSLFLLITFLFYSLLGYIIFWCYFIDSRVGITSSSILLIVSVCTYIFKSNRQRLKQFMLDPDVGIPLLMLLGTGFLYLILVYAIRPVVFDWQWAEHVFRKFGVAGDNIIPFEFAKRLYSSVDLRDQFFGDWLSSDRPPLQTGMVLVQYPLWYLLQKNALIPNLLELYYQVFCTLIQCSWISAVWALMRKLHVPVRKIILVILLLIPSGFFFFNSVFVWPKMIAGAFGIGTFCLLISLRKEQAIISKEQMFVASLFAVLGVLSHGGVAFSLIGFIIILLFPKYFPGWRNVFIGLITLFIFYAPWVAYQKYYDPPGNRLVKWHLCGVVNVDQRGTLQTITDLYSQITLSEFWGRRWGNLKTILGMDEKVNHFEDKTLDKLRRYQYKKMIPGLGLVNGGWILFLLLIFRRSKRNHDIYYPTIHMLAIGIVCFSVWLILLNSEADISHGSFSTMIMLFTGLAALLVMLPDKIFIPLVFLNAILSTVIWCLDTKPNRLVWRSELVEYMDTYYFDISMFVFAIIIYFGLTAIYYYSSNHDYIRKGIMRRSQKNESRMFEL